MVAIPLAHDQPAIAARLARLGIAEVLPVMRLTVGKIHRAVTRVLNDPTYRCASSEDASRASLSHGLQRAVDVIEETIGKFTADPRHDSAADHDRRAGSFASVSLTPR